MGLGKKPEDQTGETRKISGSFRREFIVFLILFFGLWLLSYLVTRRFPSIVISMQLLVSRELAWCLDLLGYSYRLAESTFTFFTSHGGERLVVIAECTGIYTTIIYCSIIIAYPARIGEKLIGLLIGVPSIHLLNLARMVFISLVLFHRRDLFELFHGYLWQVGFVIFMLLLVVFWMSRIVKPRGAGRSKEGDAVE